MNLILVRPRSLEENQVHLAWVHAVVLLKGALNTKGDVGNMSLETNGHLWERHIYGKESYTKNNVKIAYHRKF